MILEIEEAVARVESKLKERELPGKQDLQEQIAEPVSTATARAGDQIATNANVPAAPNQAAPSEGAPLHTPAVALEQPPSSLTEPK